MERERCNCILPPPLADNFLASLLPPFSSRHRSGDIPSHCTDQGSGCGADFSVLTGRAG